MPTVLQGAVIVSKDGLRISYKQKCEKCGHVSTSTTTMTVGSTTSSKTTSQFRCSKCGNHQRIEIQGGQG